MKKALILSFLLIHSLFLFGQGLNSSASYIKENYNQDYEATLKRHALEKWNDDFSMVVYEINKQAEAIISLIKDFKTENTNIAIKAIDKWSIDGFGNSNKVKLEKMEKFELGQLIKLHCDWSMVKYEYDKQVSAKSAF